MSPMESGQQREEEDLILDALDRFLATEVKPRVRELGSRDEYPGEIVEMMKELGLFGCLIAPEYGGLGLTTATYVKMIERMSAVWMSISGIVNSHLIMAIAVQRFGTDDQRTTFLPRFATGELRGGIALTEPVAGRTFRRFGRSRSGKATSTS